MKQIGVKSVRLENGGLVIVTNQASIPAGQATIGGKHWWKQAIHTLLHQMGVRVCDSAFDFKGNVITIVRRDMDKGERGNRPIIPIEVDLAVFMRKLCTLAGISCIENEADVTTEAVLAFAAAS